MHGDNDDDVDDSSLEDFVVEVWKPKTVAPVMFQLFHGSGVRLVDCGDERQSVKYPREHRIVVIYTPTRTWFLFSRPIFQSYSKLWRDYTTRFDYDTTTIRLRRIARACFHSMRFDASKK